MRALSLLLLLLLEPCAAPAAQPHETVEHQHVEHQQGALETPRIRVGSALSPEPAPCGVPTTFELPPDPAY